MEEHTLAPVSSRESLHLLGGLILTRERLLTLLDELDEQDLHHQVHDFPTLGGYALHLAQIELWWNKMVLTGEGLTAEDRKKFDFKEKQEITAPTGMEKSWVLARLGEARMLTREYYHSLSDFEFRKAILKVKDGDTEKVYSPEWVLYHLNHHESYHLGQMYMLLKWINGRREKWDHFNTPYLSI
ncbi:DinB family protein [Salipaludibacillus sp. CUR1]|uniref:DinB family protein n=1 Tax=Salipaludibacillus sp. CUR1 TaxID=2820003 RepID=UPI001E56D313|nr:DinB family protein [Salipaludibacillus sp. CUR1]MCE7794885.1 DinB family protein [Salipaludibacillus sp. CUR1]